MFMVIENDDDREFIAALYESKRKLWVRKAYALTHDWQTAEDMVSDSFVKLIDKIELLRSLNCYKADAYVVITLKTPARHIFRKMPSTDLMLIIMRKKVWNKSKATFQPKKLFLTSLIWSLRNQQ